MNYYYFEELEQESEEFQQLKKYVFHEGFSCKEWEHKKFYVAATIN